MDTSDTYNTIKSKCIGEVFKDKKSKFIGISVPVKNEHSVQNEIESTKKEFKNANHYCYAYKIGAHNFITRTNDDGEPRHSAGHPILGQIESHQLTNILIVVIRYYGGTKLGVGGLINAYRTAAKNALSTSRIITNTIDCIYEISFDYENMDKVMRTLNLHRAEIKKTVHKLKCHIIFSIRKNNTPKLEKSFEKFYKIAIKKL